MRGPKSALAAFALLLVAMLALPAIANATQDNTPYAYREHIRGADGVWDSFDTPGCFITSDIEAGFNRTTVQHGDDKSGSQYAGNWEGVLYHWEKSANNYRRVIYGYAPGSQLVMDNGLTSASVIAPVVVTDEEWIGPDMDENWEPLPPTSTRTYTVFVNATWTAGDEPLNSGPRHVRDVQTGMWYSVQSNGSGRDVAPNATVTGEGGEILTSGVASWGGMYEGHSVSLEKYARNQPIE
jgi:hypothetical protein